MKRKSFFTSLIGLAVAPLVVKASIQYPPAISKPVEKSTDIVVLNTCVGSALCSIEVREDAGIQQHDLISVGKYLYHVLLAKDYGCLDSKTGQFSYFQRIRLRMVKPTPYEIKVGDKVKIVSMAFGEKP